MVDYYHDINMRREDNEKTRYTRFATHISSLSMWVTVIEPVN
jgi:hypothetical protein